MTSWQRERIALDIMGWKECTHYHVNFWCRRDGTIMCGNSPGVEHTTEWLWPLHKVLIKRGWSRQIDDESVNEAALVEINQALLKNGDAWPRERARAREVEAYALRCEDLPWNRIAVKLGVSTSRARCLGHRGWARQGRPDRPEFDYGYVGKG